MSSELLGLGHILGETAIFAGNCLMEFNMFLLFFGFVDELKCVDGEDAVVIGLFFYN